MIITQRISTEWSNKSRGHPESVERNRVPRALKIPQPELNASHLVHEIVADEKSNFVLSEKIQTIDSLADYWTLTYEMLSDSVQVLFSYNYWEHGKPERISFRRPIFRLKKGHIGVFWINGRITNSEGAQYYKQHFVNIAFVEDYEPSLFISDPPTYLVDKLARLF